MRDARPPPGRPNSFDFMQFSGKFGVFTPPPRENPGSATGAAPTPEVKVKTLLPTARESNVLRSVCLFTRVGGMISLSVSGPMFSPRGVYLLGGFAS